MPVSIGQMNLIFYFHHFPYYELIAMQVLLVSLKDTKHASTFFQQKKDI